MPSSSRNARVRVPASTSNLGSGFDVLGLGLGIYLDVEIEHRDGEIVVESHGEGSELLPTDRSNLIAEMVCRAGGEVAERGFHLKVHNRIPLTRGFGSSAAAIVAGLALGMWLKEERVDEQELLRESTRIEGHPDNVSASIFGGLTASAVVDEQVISHRMRLPEEVEVVGIVPDRELSTRAAREALPDAYDRSDVVFNLQRLAMLLTSISNGDLEAIGAGVEDRLHQEYRMALMPEMRDVLQAIEACEGALGGFVSGAGPAIAALVRGNGEHVGEVGAKAFQRHGIEAEYKLLSVDYQGFELSIG